MIPPRTPDWQARLTGYLAAAARARFAPGRMDCALFAAGAVEAMTGVDPAAAWRGRYRSLAGGSRLLAKAGHPHPESLVATLFAATCPASALPGDLAAVGTAEGPALGVVQGAFVYVRRPDGLGLVPLPDALRAWRVP
jgi:hypothetical protein